MTNIEQFTSIVCASLANVYGIEYEIGVYNDDKTLSETIYQTDDGKRFQIQIIELENIKY